MSLPKLRLPQSLTSYTPLSETVKAFGEKVTIYTTSFFAWSSSFNETFIAVSLLCGMLFLLICLTIGGPGLSIKPHFKPQKTLRTALPLSFTKMTGKSLLSFLSPPPLACRASYSMHCTPVTSTFNWQTRTSPTTDGIQQIQCIYV